MWKLSSRTIRLVYQNGLTGKYKSVFEGMIKPFALIDLSAASRSPPCRILEMSPLCQVFKSASMSFASQVATYRASQFSRSQEFKSGNLDNSEFKLDYMLVKDHKDALSIEFIFVFAEPLYVANIRFRADRAL